MEQQIPERERLEKSRLKKILPDDIDDRRNAVNINQSFIVQAPAGSGKTTVLTERVLALLAKGVSTPEECLCITFTQKAAAEMRERVLGALERASKTSNSSPEQDSTSQMLAQQVLERDALLGWDLLNNPNRLRIQTIDSLCAELAQRMPLHSGLGSAMKITETPDIFYEEAARTVLESLEHHEAWTEALQTLLKHLDNDWEAAVQLLAEMLSHRDQWLLSLGPAFFNQPDRTQLELGLQICVRDTLKLAKSKLPPAIRDQLLMLIRFAASQLQTSYTDNCSEEQSEIELWLHAQEWPNDELQDYPLWRGLTDLLLTEANQLRKTVTERQGFPSQQKTKDKDEKALFKNMKEEMQTCLANLKEYPDFCLALQAIRECPPTHYTETQWEVVQALLTLLPILVGELMLTFQKQGQVDFIEVSLAAHRALGDRENPTDIALKLGYKIRHILLDEFQDTSLSQFYLLEKLTLTWSEYEGNTLFLVGDPMQSIYRFRRADVGLFLQAKNSGINDFCLQSLKLTANFRSDPCIIEWVNKSFSEIFPKQEDMLTGAICYTPFQAAVLGEKLSYPSNDNITTIAMDAEVLIHSVSSETEEAVLVVECIEKIKRKYPAESMVLLVRSRNHLKYIIPLLERKGISYQGVELERLSSRPVIRDLLSLSNALFHLGNRLAWLSLLHSPYGGISLSDLEILATFNETLPLFWSLQQYESIPLLSPSAARRLKILVPIFEAALFEREQLPVSTWIRNTWNKLLALSTASDCAGLPLASDHEESEVFFKILRKTAKNEDIFKIGLLEQKINDHYATQKAQDRTALQIMTIHKAKGLEFDTVLLAGLGRKERNDSRRLLLWEERRTELGGSYLLLAPIRSAETKKDPIYEYLRKQEQRRARYENQRLLYVAATRSKKRLYGFTHHKTLLADESEIEP